MEGQYRNLIQYAIKARKRSYAPYSGFHVGAALLAESGEIYTGCNIENAAYSPSNCAERTAFFNAISSGAMQFSMIAIVGGEDDLKYCPPCGVCLQVMREFCKPKEFIVILATSTEGYRTMTLQALLPEGFGPENL